MKKNLPLSFCLSGLLLLLFARAAGAQGNPAPPDKPVLRITFEKSAVVASGLTAGDTVVWFGVESRVDEDLSRELVRHDDIGDVAANGTARLALTSPVSQRSVWVVVALKSGDFAIASPDGSPSKLPQKPSQLGTRAGSADDEILDERPYLIGLVVRPGDGAWVFAGGDGGPRDEDGRNDGHLRFALGQLQPLPGSPESPAKVGDKDLWFIVDPLKMEIAVHKGGIAQ